MSACRKACGMSVKKIENHWPSQWVTAWNWEDLQLVSYQLLGPLMVIMTLVCFGVNY